LNKEGFDVHLSQKLKPFSNLSDILEAVDFGYTEVMTDTRGKQYGRQFGTILTKATNERHEKMQKRNRNPHRFKNRSFPED
jgi:hypothetical protein